jgi:hypothetical protein
LIDTFLIQLYISSLFNTKQHSLSSLRVVVFMSRQLRLPALVFCVGEERAMDMTFSCMIVLKPIIFINTEVLVASSLWSNLLSFVARKIEFFVHVTKFFGIYIYIYIYILRHLLRIHILFCRQKYYRTYEKCLLYPRYYNCKCQ